MEAHPPETAETPFRPPRQDRSRRTLARIVDAALDLLAERGAEATTVHDIVGRAGSSVGSFYARFSGKDELLRHLEIHVWERARERWDGALAARSWDGLPLARVVEDVVWALLATWRASLRGRRALGTAAQARASWALQQHVRESVGPLLLAHRASIEHPDPALAVELGLRAVVGTFGELDAPAGEAASPVPGAVPGRLDALDDDVLVAELARLWLAYLGSPGRMEAKEEREPMEFFEIWG